MADELHDADDDDPAPLRTTTAVDASSPPALSAEDPLWWNDLLPANGPPPPKPVLKAVRLHPHARVPTPCPITPGELFAYTPLQGWFLYAGPSYTLALPSCSRTSVPTALQLQVPRGHVAVISSLERTGHSHLYVPLTCLYPDTPGQLSVDLENRQPIQVTIHPLQPVARFFLMKMESDVVLEVG